MENHYTAYTKEINGNTFHFVKHFQIFPEYKDLPPVLENFGMHIDFYKACKIAMVEDKAIQEQLLASVSNNNVSAEIIHMHHDKASLYHYGIRQLNFPGLLNRIGIGKLLHFKQKIA